MSVLGVWMWPQSVRLCGAQCVADRCARAGVTDILFLTKGLAGTASYLSALAPACCERDLLRELIDAAHAKGIRVHAWLTSASDEHYKELHPESGRCHYTRGRDRGLISLADEGYLDYMKAVVRELCRGYEIDGLHLDYIRYNHLLYGWAQEDEARYAAAGADVAHLHALMDRTFCKEEANEPDCIFDAFRAGDPSAVALARVRREDVRRFGSALIRLAREEKPVIHISAALMPEGAYSDTAFADLHYGQSYEDAAALCDSVMPMAYSQAYEKDGQWVRMVAEGTLQKGVKTVMGLHAYEGGTALTLQEDMAALEGAAIDGICLFREGAFVMAFAAGCELLVCNTLDKPVTGLLCGDLRLETTLQPGEERSFTLEAAPQTVRAFAGEAEVCVYLVHE